MRNKFDIELEDLNLDLIRMGARAEQTITKVVKVIENCDEAGAREIIEDDDLVDAMARQIESRSMKLIMKQQPVAKDHFYGAENDYGYRAHLRPSVGYFRNYAFRMQGNYDPAAAAYL